MGLNHTLLVLQLGVDGRYDLANVDPGHCVLGLSKATCTPVWRVDWGQHAGHECPLAKAVSMFS